MDGLQPKIAERTLRHEHEQPRTLDRRRIGRVLRFFVAGQRFMDFINDIVLVQITGQIVIFFDEAYTS